MALRHVALSEDPEMQEVAVESAARVVDAVEQTGLVMLLNELVGPMQERRGESRAGQTGGKDGRWLRRGVRRRQYFYIFSVTLLVFPEKLYYYNYWYRFRRFKFHRYVHVQL